MVARVSITHHRRNGDTRSLLVDTTLWQGLYLFFRGPLPAFDVAALADRWAKPALLVPRSSRWSEEEASFPPELGLSAGLRLPCDRLATASRPPCDRRAGQHRPGPVAARSNKEASLWRRLNFRTERAEPLLLLLPVSSLMLFLLPALAPAPVLVAGHGA